MTVFLVLFTLQFALCNFEFRVLKEKSPSVDEYCIEVHNKEIVNILQGNEELSVEYCFSDVNKGDGHFASHVDPLGTSYVFGNFKKILYRRVYSKNSKMEEKYYDEDEFPHQVMVVVPSDPNLEMVGQYVKPITVIEEIELFDGIYSVDTNFDENYLEFFESVVDQISGDKHTVYRPPVSNILLVGDFKFKTVEGYDVNYVALYDSKVERWFNVITSGYFPKREVRHCKLLPKVIICESNRKVIVFNYNKKFKVEGATVDYKYDFYNHRSVANGYNWEKTVLNDEDSYVKEEWNDYIWEVKKTMWNEPAKLLILGGRFTLTENHTHNVLCQHFCGVKLDGEVIDFSKDVALFPNLTSTYDEYFQNPEKAEHPFFNPYITDFGITYTGGDNRDFPVYFISLTRKIYWFNGSHVFEFCDVLDGPEWLEPWDFSLRIESIVVVNPWEVEVLIVQGEGNDIRYVNYMCGGEASSTEDTWIWYGGGQDMKENTFPVARKIVSSPMIYFENYPNMKSAGQGSTIEIYSKTELSANMEFFCEYGMSPYTSTEDELMKNETFKEMVFTGEEWLYNETLEFRYECQNIPREIPSTYYDLSILSVDKQGGGVYRMLSSFYHLDDDEFLITSSIVEDEDYQMKGGGLILTGGIIAFILWILIGIVMSLPCGSQSFNYYRKKVFQFVYEKLFPEEAERAEDLKKQEEVMNEVVKMRDTFKKLKQKDRVGELEGKIMIEKDLDHHHHRRNEFDVPEIHPTKSKIYGDDIQQQQQQLEEGGEEMIFDGSDDEHPHIIGGGDDILDGDNVFDDDDEKKSSSSSSSSKKKEVEEEKEEEEEGEGEEDRFIDLTKGDPESATSNLGIYVTLSLLLFYVFALLYSVEMTTNQFQRELYYVEDFSRHISEREKILNFYVQDTVTKEFYDFSLRQTGTNSYFEVPRDSKLLRFVLPVEENGEIVGMTDNELIIYKKNSNEFLLNFGASLFFTSLSHIEIRFSYVEFSEARDGLSWLIISTLLPYLPFLEDYYTQNSRICLELSKVIIKGRERSFSERKIEVSVEPTVSTRYVTTYPTTGLIIAAISLLGSCIALRYPIFKCLYRYSVLVHPRYPYTKETIVVLSMFFVDGIILYGNQMKVWKLDKNYKVPYLGSTVCLLALLVMLAWNIGLFKSWENIKFLSCKFWMFACCCVEPTTRSCYICLHNPCYCCCLCPCYCLILFIFIGLTIPYFVFFGIFLDHRSYNVGGFSSDFGETVVLDYSHATVAINYVCVFTLLVMVIIWKCCCLGKRMKEFPRPRGSGLWKKMMEKFFPKKEKRSKNEIGYDGDEEDGEEEEKEMKELEYSTNEIESSDDPYLAGAKSDFHQVISVEQKKEEKEEEEARVVVEEEEEVEVGKVVVEEEKVEEVVENVEEEEVKSDKSSNTSYSTDEDDD